MKSIKEQFNSIGRGTKLLFIFSLLFFLLSLAVQAVFATEISLAPVIDDMSTITVYPEYIEEYDSINYIVDVPVIDDCKKETVIPDTLDTGYINPYVKSYVPVLGRAIPDGSTVKYLGNYKVTGYDTCTYCCGKTDGITASGAKAIPYYTVAMNGIPFGTKIYVEGYGVYIVQDRGGSKIGVDIVCESHDICYKHTKNNVEVYIIEEND